MNESKYEEQNKKYESYIGTLRTKFDSLSEPQRDRVLSSMEKLLSNVLVIGMRKQVVPVNKSDFDYERAKPIREGKNLTQTELAKQLGVSQRTISNYEMGRPIPDPKEYETSRKYLAWLSQHGFKTK